MGRVFLRDTKIKPGIVIEYEFKTKCISFFNPEEGIHYYVDGGDKHYMLDGLSKYLFKDIAELIAMTHGLDVKPFNLNPDSDPGFEESHGLIRFQFVD